MAEGGLVDVDYTKCIGCGVCVTACPYGARLINTRGGWFFDMDVPAPYETADPARLGVAEKCDFCSERRARNLDPACVAACPVGIRVFGDLDNSEDPIHSFIEEVGAHNITGTASYYTVVSPNVDAESAISELGRRSCAAYAASQPEHAGTNLVVIAAAAAAGAVSVAGIATLAHHDRRSRRARDECTEEKGSFLEGF